jgi:hypothetical protein
VYVPYAWLPQVSSWDVLAVDVALVVQVVDTGGSLPRQAYGAGAADHSTVGENAYPLRQEPA